jgi:DNA-binding MarR family transcriptional regulator
MSDGPDPRSFDTRDPSPRDPRAAEPRDPRDVLTSGLDLPRGSARERVYVHQQEYKLRGSEARALATIGTFRVVPASDLRDDHGRPGNLQHGDLERLRQAGLVRPVAPVEGLHRTTLVTLTERGRELLEHHRTPDQAPAQRFYAGPSKPRELSHDAHLYRAYLRSADRLQAQGASIHRVVLEDDLKREYQAFLQEGNRDQPESDGRPTRSLEEIHEWAHTHDLPVLEDSVQFPDLRLEYEWPDGRRDMENVEVLTPHYRGAHAAAKARSGFTGYRGGGARVGGRSGRSGRGGRPFDPHLADEFLR